MCGNANPTSLAHRGRRSALNERVRTPQWALDLQESIHPCWSTPHRRLFVVTLVHAVGSRRRHIVPRHPYLRVKPVDRSSRVDGAFSSLRSMAAVPKVFASSRQDAHLVPLQTSSRTQQRSSSSVHDNTIVGDGSDHMLPFYSVCGNSQNLRNFTPFSPGGRVGLASLDSKRLPHGLVGVFALSQGFAWFTPAFPTTKSSRVCAETPTLHASFCASQSSLSLEHQLCARSFILEAAQVGAGLTHYFSGGGVQTVETMSPPLPRQQIEARSD